MHVAIMLSFILCLNMGLNSSRKTQKSSLDWWCYLYIGRYCWTRSTMLSCLFILGTKKRMLYCLLMFGGPKCENHVRGFAGSFSFFNMQRTAHRHPQVCWNHYLLLIGGLDHGQWTLSLSYLYVQMVATQFSPVLIV